MLLISVLAVSCRSVSAVSGSDSSIGDSDITADENAETASSDPAGSEAAEEDQQSEMVPFRITDHHHRKLLESGLTYKESVYFPVHKTGRVKYIEENLDNSEGPEIFVLYAYGDTNEKTEITYLSDIRNFIDESLYDKYLVAVYKPVYGLLKLHEILPLKYRSVLKDFSVKNISEDTLKRAISVSFTGEDGVTDNFLTFSPIHSYSVFSMNNTLTEFNRVEDIDKDGSLEIIRYEDLFEEGLGYETFITLFELTDSGFSSKDSVSTVRNLRKFLESSEEYLESKNISGFLNHAVPPVILNKQRSRMLSDKNIVRKIFFPVKKENELFPDINVFLKKDGKIDIVFPDIVENPFRFDRSNTYNFTTYVKVNGENREEAIYIVEIYMNSNPFDNPMFSFHIN